MLIALQAAPANYQNKAHNIPQAATQSGAPFDYLVIILMENHGIGAITPDAAPYMTQLATNYGLATHYTALTHPSMANYIALTSGDTYGTDDGQGVGTVNAVNIIDRLDATGKTWKVYQESYDGGCSDSGSNYSVNHNPFVKYVDVANNPTRCAKIVNTGDNAGAAGSVFLNDLASASPPNYMWLTPNRCNDMHDCDVPTGNSYLAQLVPQILNSNTFQTKKAALFITFDEGDNSYPNDYVWTIWAGPVAKTHYQSSAQYDHYSALKTIETAWGLQPFTTKDGGAADMSGFFTGNPGRPNLTASFSYSPTDPLTGQTITFTPSVAGGTPPFTYTWGFGDGATTTTSTATHSYTTAGGYTVTLTVRDSQTNSTTATKSLMVSTRSRPDFSLNANPSSLNIQTGASDTSTIIVDSVGGYGGTVNLDATVSPTGLSSSLNPPSVQVSPGSSGSSTLTVDAPQSTPTGPYTVTVTCTNGTVTRSIDITVNIVTQPVHENTPPEISLPGSETVRPEASLTFKVTATDPDGEPVTLTVAGLPSGANFDPNTGVFAWTPSPHQAGNYTITFKAMDDGTPQMTTTKTVTIEVSAAPTNNSGNTSNTPGNLLLFAIGGLLAITGVLGLATMRARGKLKDAKKRITGQPNTVRNKQQA